MLRPGGIPPLRERQPDAAEAERPGTGPGAEAVG
jgi:hypothetical protein